ncbi:MAG: hypothetical protein AAF587_39305 [Bacteroidota bacterium]
MTDPHIKQIILDIFIQMRKRPSTLYEDSHFMDYLTHPPHRKDGLKGSFSGSKAYYRFLSRLELEFAICFTQADQDRYYSVDQMVAKVQERIHKRRGNVIIIKRRKEDKHLFLFEILLSLLLFMVWAWLKFHWLSIFAGVAYLLILSWSIRNLIFERRHTHALYEIIMGQQ